MTVSMEDIAVASAVRNGKQTYVKVDDDLYRYLLMILAKMVDPSRPTSNVIAVLHTLLEIGIEAGVHAGMREAKRLVLEAAAEHGVEIPEELKDDRN